MNDCDSENGPPGSEREIRRALDRVSDGFVILGDDFDYRYVNDAAGEMLDYSPEALVGRSASNVFPDVAGTIASDRLKEALETGESVTFERYNEQYDTWWEVTAYPDESGLSVFFRDITDRKHRLHQLEAFSASLESLTSAATDILDAESSERIYQILAETAEEIFESELTAVLRYDGANHRLEPAILLNPNGMEPDFPPIEPNDSTVWDAFTQTEIKSEHNVTESWCGDHAPCDYFALPLGDHGVMVLIVEDTTVSNDQWLRLGDLVSSIGNVGLERSKHRDRIRERQRDLERTERRLEELVEITEFAVRLQQDLWQTESHERLYTEVCTNLAELSDVELVLIGEYSPGEERLEPVEWAGSAGGYVDGINFEVDPENTEPPIRAILEEESILIGNIVSEAPNAQWRTSALDNGLASVLSIPLEHDNMLYGVLSVYYGDPMDFPDQRKMAHQGLASAIARALTSIDRRRGLGTQERVELEFETVGVESPLKRVASAIGSDFRIESAVRQSDRSYLLYGSLLGGSVESFEEAVETVPSIIQHRLLQSTDEGFRFEVTIQQDVPPGTILDLGGRFEELRVFPDRCLLRASFSPEASIKNIMDTVVERHPEWELRARRSTTEEGGTSGAGIGRAELSDRQSTIVKAALESGYFEWPRETTAEELADKLDVSPPTVHRHLRSGMEKLGREHFEEE